MDLFQNGNRVREFPLIFGIAMAFTVLLLAGLCTQPLPYITPGSILQRSNEE